MNSEPTVLRIIAAFKFLKAATLIATGIGLLKLMHRDVGTALEQWIAATGLDPGKRFVSHAIQLATNLPHDRIKDLGLVSFIYAALFLVEGVGLWLLKRWAEWFTICITASLVPIEIYELAHHPSALKGLALGVNVAVVLYLLYRIRSDRKEAKPEPASRPSRILVKPPSCGKTT